MDLTILGIDEPTERVGPQIVSFSDFPFSCDRNLTFTTENALWIGFNPSTTLSEFPTDSSIFTNALLTGAGSRSQIVIDFSNVRFLNVDALGPLMAVRANLKREGKSLLFYGLKGQPSDVFNRHKWGQFFQTTEIKPGGERGVVDFRAHLEKAEAQEIQRLERTGQSQSEPSSPESIVTFFEPGTPELSALEATFRFTPGTELTEERVYTATFINDILSRSQNKPVVRLDLNNVDFVDAMFISTLLIMHRMHGSKNGPRLELLNIKPSVMESFRTKRLDRVFNIKTELGILV